MNTEHYNSQPRIHVYRALFETTASALDRLRLAWPAPPVVLTILCMLCVYTLRASDERTEPQAEAVVSKRAFKTSICGMACSV